MSIEEASEKEIKLIQEYNSLVPNGYNIAKGGMYNSGGLYSRFGNENNNAKLTYEEAKYIKDNRDKPEYILYEEFSDKISYEAFKKCYNHKTYLNIEPTVEPYPYNLEFSCQFTGTNKLEYPEVVDLRTRYARGEYWKKVYEDYRHIYPDEWTFWNIYYGNCYRLVMPEVFTKENRKKHSALSKQGTKNGRAKLSEQDVLEIRKKWKEGISRSELYKQYPQVSATSIRDIINNKTWKHLL